MIYGQPVTFGGKSEPVLLWQNASPSSSFAAQTVNVNGSGYGAYLVEVSPNKGIGPHPGIAYIWFDESDSDTYNQVIATQGKLLSSSGTEARAVTAATTSGITFDAAYSGTTQNNAVAIPTRIWGVKFTL